MVAAATGEVDRAARLYGVVEGQRNRTGEGPSVDPPLPTDRERGWLQVRLGVRRFHALRREGEALTWEQGLRYALSAAAGDDGGTA